MLSAIHRRRVGFLRVGKTSRVQFWCAWHLHPSFKRKPRKRNTTTVERDLRIAPFFSRFCHLRVYKTVWAFVGFVCLLRPSFLGLQTASPRCAPLRSPEGGQTCLWAEGRAARPGPHPAKNRCLFPQSRKGRRSAFPPASRNWTGCWGAVLSPVP